MEVLTLEDMLYHYKVKLSDALEYERKSVSKARIALEAGQESWEGESGKAFRIRLEETLLQLEKAEAAMEDALAQIEELIVLA